MAQIGEGAEGPSPRVRGKPTRRRPPCRRPRSIPASAGETLLLPAGDGELRVHPRECGGNEPRLLGVGGQLGPSPRVRGKHQDRPGRGVWGGSIPASAGETTSRKPSALGRRVHPRECGGNGNLVGRKEGIRGPSPRVRGKPRGRRALRLGLGSIPASAGETELRKRRYRV